MTATMTLNIQRNPQTGGNYCEFEYKGKSYYADRSNVPYIGIETMIFEVNDGQVDWSELYADRSGMSLTDCIKEFCETL